MLQSKLQSNATNDDAMKEPACMFAVMRGSSPECWMVVVMVATSFGERPEMRCQMWPSTGTVRELPASTAWKNVRVE